MLRAPFIRSSDRQIKLGGPRCLIKAAQQRRLGGEGWKQHRLLLAKRWTRQHAEQQPTPASQPRPSPSPGAAPGRLDPRLVRVAVSADACSRVCGWMFDGGAPRCLKRERRPSIICPSIYPHACLLGCMLSRVVCMARRVIESIPNH
jgi:hypothetical protein